MFGKNKVSETIGYTYQTHFFLKSNFFIDVTCSNTKTHGL